MHNLDSAAAPDGLLYVIDLSGGRIFSVNPDGTERKVIVSDCRVPDGIAIDATAGHLYWTNMGTPHLDDGTIERVDLDGGNRCTIVPAGITFTPKQLQLDARSGTLYWCDREGMRVMRCALDGSAVATLVVTGHGAEDRLDQRRWCVGLCVDTDAGLLYWSQKGPDNGGAGRILRAPLALPAGADPGSRSDITVLFDGLPEPIDLELDAGPRMLYWTDRGDPPRGNTVNRAAVDAIEPGITVPEIVFSHLMEGIGIALDLDGGRMFMTDLGGSVYTARLDGSGSRTLLQAQGNLTGIAYTAPVLSPHEKELPHENIN